VSTKVLNALTSRPRLAPYAAPLAAALATTPDPRATLPRAADVLDAAAIADEARLADTLTRHLDAVARILGTLCASAPFFAPILMRHPEWIGRLAEEDLEQRREAAAYAGRLASALADAPMEARPDLLRRFKYYELARITIRELSPDLVPLERVGDTLAELSHLADVLLSAALETAALRIAQRHAGDVRWGRPAAIGDGGSTPGFVVLGLGKLGAEELNYSSDVDLVYVFDPAEAPGATAGGERDGHHVGLAPVEYHTRLAQELGRIVAEATGEGFLYRVDLDLRPEGTKGPLVVSSDALADYHESWAATWEKAAYMKARPVAGDLRLGWRVVRSISPMIYRSTMDYRSIAAIKSLKEKVGQAAGRPGDPFNVKLGSGGIRDIESIAQALQLLHGGRIPEVRGRGTEATLHSLAQVGALPDREAGDLLAAYRFLRRTENLLQMAAERQTHTLPKSADDMGRVATGMGLAGDDPVATFTAHLEAHRDAVRRAAAELFHEGGRERVLALFQTRVPRLPAEPMTGRMIEELAARFAREIDLSADPERALNNLDRFIAGVGSRGFYYQLLHDRPELVPRLTALFATSQFLSSYFAAHPRLIEPIFDDPEVLLHDRAQLEENFTAVRRDLLRDRARDGVEVELEALRLAHHREILNIGLLDLDGRISRAEVETALTEVAEVCLERALRLARDQTERSGIRLPATGGATEFLVVGMGKLASRELTYGSDLDVIFLYDGPDGEALLDAQQYFVRVAQKLIWVLATKTAAGFCYEVDARLRPSGNQGTLVTTLRGFDRYHEGTAQVWERQALLRARAVAGSGRPDGSDDRLGRSDHLSGRFDDVRRRILRRPLPANAGEEIHRIRLRMESELGRETLQRHNFKAGHGGILDVETVVQYLQLRHGGAHPELHDVERVEGQLARLRSLDLLGPEDACVLAEGWEFLQRLSARLRIVENRSISDLDEERGDLDAVARGLGYAGQERPGSACRALLDDYRRHTGAIRSVYRAVLGVAGERS
jgi:glutamate-ammonia-ligase adenylyltransferase